MLTARAVQSFQLPYIDYVVHYDELALEYENVFEMSKFIFTKMQLDNWKLFSKYIDYQLSINNGSTSVKQPEVIQFEEEYSQWLRVLSITIDQNTLSITRKADRVISFLENQLSRFHHPENDLAESDKIIGTLNSNDFIPIKLTDKVKINEIVTFFYDLLKESKISSSKENLKKIILTIFVDKDNNKLKKSTLDTYLNQSKVHSRSKRLK